MFWFTSVVCIFTRLTSHFLIFFRWNTFFCLNDFDLFFYFLLAFWTKFESFQRKQIFYAHWILEHTENDNIFMITIFSGFFSPFFGLIGFSLYYIGLLASYCLVWRANKVLWVFWEWGGLIIFSEVWSLVDFFWPKGILTRYFRLCYRWVHYLPMLIPHSIILACFRFKLALFILTDLLFQSF